ncbi:hypothetical protein ACRBEV_23900 [Methylobacterium phyllosphaerae]
MVRSIARLAAGAEAAAGNLAGVSQGAEETGGAAELVLCAAIDMLRRSEQLSAEIHRFLDGIRAA